MNKLVVITLLFFGLFSCTPKNPNSTGDNSSSDEPAELKKDASGKVILPERMKYIVNHYWWYEGYVSSRQDYRLEQRGKWFKFKDDGTFQYGKFQEDLGIGKWRYNDRTANLYLYTDDGAETRQWETMMNHTNDIMVWMGPPSGPNGGDQAKLQPYLQKPTENDVFK